MAETRFKFTLLIFVAVFTASIEGFHMPIVADAGNECVNEYDKVCVDCRTVGTCRMFNGTFSVVTTEVCTSEGEVCSSEYDEAGCYRVAPYLSPDCLCAKGQSCSVDPFDPKDYVLCEDSSISYGTCGTYDNFFNTTTCSCEKKCSSCGTFYPGPDPDNCSSYYECNEGDWIEKTCPDDLCFNSRSCSCDIDCPPCGYAPYPGDPTKFIYCGNGDYITSSCFEGGEFDSKLCKCFRPDGSMGTTSLPVGTTELNGRSTSSSQPNESTVHGQQSTTIYHETSSTTSKTELCDHCGFYDHPDPDCTKYIECNPDGSTQERNCPSHLCFNPSTCNCDIIKVDTTEAPVFTTVDGYNPCASCGFFNKPGENCTTFHECQGDGTTIMKECPEQLCFNPETCHCELF